MAEEVFLPGDEAQTWLERNVFPETGIRPSGGDLAAIHHAKNVLWGAWGNAAFLADEGRPDAELAEYLRHWRLYTDREVAPALAMLRPSPMSPYVFAYSHGWELVQPWVATRPDRVRRPLTEQPLPADLTP